MEKSRISALVDGIFAVAMTLLVLDLKLPEGVKISIQVATIADPCFKRAAKQL